MAAKFIVIVRVVLFLLLLIAIIVASIVGGEVAAIVGGVVATLLGVLFCFSLAYLIYKTNPKHPFLIFLKVVTLSLCIILGIVLIFYGAAVVLGALTAGVAASGLLGLVVGPSVAAALGASPMIALLVATFPFLEVIAILLISVVLILGMVMGVSAYINSKKEIKIYLDDAEIKEITDRLAILKSVAEDEKNLDQEVMSSVVEDEKNLDREVMNSNVIEEEKIEEIKDVLATLKSIVMLTALKSVEGHEKLTWEVLEEKIESSLFNLLKIEDWKRQQDAPVQEVLNNNNDFKEVISIRNKMISMVRNSEFTQLPEKEKLEKIKAISLEEDPNSIQPESNPIKADSFEPSIQKNDAKKDMELNKTEVDYSNGQTKDDSEKAGPLGVKK